MSFAKFLLIQYFIDINILQNSLIAIDNFQNFPSNIDIDIFQNFLTDIYIDTCSNFLSDIKKINGTPISDESHDSGFWSRVYKVVQGEE